MERKNKKIYSSRDRIALENAKMLNNLLLFGSDNPENKSFNRFFDRKIKSVSILKQGEEGKYVKDVVAGACNTSYPEKMVDIELKGYSGGKPIVHFNQYVHEITHAYQSITPMFFKRQRDVKKGSLTKTNLAGRIAFLEENEFKYIYGSCILETLTDMLVNAGLIAYTSYYQNSNVCVNDVFTFNHEYWKSTTNAYTSMTSLARLLYSAFQNAPNINFQDLIDSGNGVYDAVYETLNGKCKYVNDLMYGIMFDPFHIEDTYNKVMGKGRYRELALSMDAVFERVCENSNISKEDTESIKKIMIDIANFMYSKCMDRIKSGEISRSELTKLLIKFNNIFNNIIREYHIPFSEEEKQKVLSYKHK